MYTYINKGWMVFSKDQINHDQNLQLPNEHLFLVTIITNSLLLHNSITRMAKVFTLAPFNIVKDIKA